MALSRIKFNGPTTYTDGSPFGAEDLAGYRVFVDDQPAVDLPTAWNPDNVYEITFEELGLPYGPHTVSVATIARNGQVSVPSEPVSFVFEDERVPNPPTSLQAV